MNAIIPIEDLLLSSGLMAIRREACKTPIGLPIETLMSTMMNGLFWEEAWNILSLNGWILLPVSEQTGIQKQMKSKTMLLLYLCWLRVRLKALIFWQQTKVCKIMVISLQVFKRMFQIGALSWMPVEVLRIWVSTIQQIPIN